MADLDLRGKKVAEFKEVSYPKSDPMWLTVGVMVLVGVGGFVLLCAVYGFHPMALWS